MKFIIFGTGKYCLKYLKYIDDNEILFFIDNDTDKHGKEIEGKQVCSIDSILKVDYDYIIILVKKYDPIVKQLLELGVLEHKIVPYARLVDIVSLPQSLSIEKSKESMYGWAMRERGKKILICSHDFSRTGVPVALMNLAVLLKQMNYRVFMIAEGNGTLEQELEIRGIDFIADVECLYLSKKFITQLKEFDMIILGTLVLANMGKALSKLNIPIFWWMHESEDSLYQGHQLPENQGNIHYYGGGSRVLGKFSEYYPDETMKELLYYLPDSPVPMHEYSQVRVFALIGTWCERKAQDILISTIRELDAETREKSVFYFVGATLEEERNVINNLCDEIKEIKYLYELNQAELAEFYKEIDVLICPSRDDPMPIVVTQALQNGIPCIISDQVGQCEYFSDIEGGVVFPSEDVQALKQFVIEFASCSNSKMEEYSQNARKIFDLHFSEQIMKENMEKILEEILSD